ncbi:MAG: hypothetical protein AAF685_13110 [Cyanobacteria bacterium P01_C01_bin.89]
MSWVISLGRSQLQRLASPAEITRDLNAPAVYFAVYLAVYLALCKVPHHHSSTRFST